MTAAAAPAGVDHSVRAIASWLAAHAPALAASLDGPATPDAVAEVEEVLGRPLPADYRAFLARHDGQRFVPVDAEHGTLAPLFNGLDLLSVRLAAGEYETMLDEWDDEGPGDIVALGPVRPLYKHALWWPITCLFGASQYHCIDLDPAPGGAVGQVIFVADDDEQRRVVAPSFAAFLEMLAAALTAPGVTASEEGIDLPDEVFDRLIAADLG